MLKTRGSYLLCPRQPHPSVHVGPNSQRSSQKELCENGGLSAERKRSLNKRGKMSRVHQRGNHGEVKNLPSRKCLLSSTAVNSIVQLSPGVVLSLLLPESARTACQPAYFFFPIVPPAKTNNEEKGSLHGKVELLALKDPACGCQQKGHSHLDGGRQQFTHLV